MISYILFAAALVSIGKRLANNSISPIGILVGLLITVLAAAGTRSTRPWDELRDTKAIQLIIAALEPPDSVDSPPNAAHDEPDAPDDPG